MATLAGYLDKLSAEGTLVESLAKDAVRCFACAHRCVIQEGKRGICKVRFNQGGRLRVPWGYVAGLAADPIEKKPFFHVFPGAEALTFGMLGCDFHCQYCQNWLSSQVLREAACDLSVRHVHEITPEQVVVYARQTHAQVIASSYNEPLITAEWAAAIFKPAVEAGLKCAIVSNGNATLEVLGYLRPYLSAMKIDLKTMQDKQYRQLGGVLQNVLNGIKMAHEIGLWVEVVTLVVPGFTDSNEELMEAARFLVSVSADIPWHVTAFHPDFKMTSHSATPAKTLQRAAEIGEEAGLHYVYAGNLRGQIGNYENTRCPNCGAELVERFGYTIHAYRISSAGTCPQCATAIAGIWHKTASEARLHGAGLPRQVGM